MLVHRRAWSWSSWPVFRSTVLGSTLAAASVAAAQSYPQQQYPPQYQAQPAPQSRPQSAYAQQPRPGYGAANAGGAQQIPAQATGPYRAMPAQAVAPAQSPPAGGYPPAQQYPAQQPAQQQYPAAQQGLPAQQYPVAQSAPGQVPPGYGAQPQQPIRLAQQPGAAGQTLSTASSDMSIPPMENNAPAPMGNNANPPATVPVELNAHVGAATEHPLAAAIRWANSELANIRAIRDYSCIFYKRERIDGQLGGYQAMYMKVRHEPFSIYMYFKSPSNLEGQEVIYVKGLNDNNLQAHTTGIKSVVGTVSLSPTGTLAMKGNRYPITEAGMLNLMERLVTVGSKDMQYGECDVQYFTSAQGVKVGGRPCTCIQVSHPVPRRNFLFHQSRIYIDEELRLPIRYESYDWPTQPGGKPILMEEYTYQNLKINNGFTDLDFDVRNPKYGFNK